MQLYASLQVNTTSVQVYVFCSAHAEQIQEHLDAAGWMQQRDFHVQACLIGLAPPVLALNPSCMTEGLGHTPVVPINHILSLLLANVC